MLPLYLLCIAPEALLASILPIHPSYSCPLRETEKERERGKGVEREWERERESRGMVLLWWLCIDCCSSSTTASYNFALSRSVFSHSLTPTPHLHPLYPPYSLCPHGTLVPVVTNAECNVALVLSVLVSPQNPWFFLLSFQIHLNREWHWRDK